MALDARIELSEKEVDIYIGKNGDFSGPIWKSDNNKYIFSVGTYYKNENDGGTENIILFTETEIIYKKKVEFADIESIQIFDDGSVVFYTDENQLIALDSLGKQKFKKAICIDFDADTCGLNEDFAYFEGYDDNDKIVLTVVNYESKKLWKKEILDIEQIGEEEPLYADDTEFYKCDRGFIVLYADKKTIVMYDNEGNVLCPNDKEISEVITYVNNKEKLQEIERERKKQEREEYLLKKENEKKKNGFLKGLFGRK